MEDLDRQDELMESLTLDRTLEDAKSPPYGGYIPESSYWYSYSWNKPGGFDIVYRNKLGMLHRLYGPAYISKIYDTEIWYKEGEFHRVDGPAIRHKTVHVWYYEGKLHRIGGPAITSQGGPKQYWIHGQRLSPKEYKKEMARRQKKGHYARER